MKLFFPLPCKLSNPKQGCTTGESGRAAHGWPACCGGSGKLGRHEMLLRRLQPSILHPRASNTVVLNISLRAGTRQFDFKPLGKQNMPKSIVQDHIFLQPGFLFWLQNNEPMLCCLYHVFFFRRIRESKCLQIPGHDLHENELQKQIGVGTVVNSRLHSR